MSPRQPHTAPEEVQLNVMDSVDPADIDRLISQVQEPDDQVFHQLDMNSRSNGERREHALLHAMAVSYTHLRAHET